MSHEETQPSADLRATSSLPTGRSEGGSVWLELRDDEISILETFAQPTKRPARVFTLRVARALLSGGAELSKGANALSLPVGLFVAGAGLMLAAVVQLAVILPALLLRQGLVRYANWTIRHSTVLRGARPRLAH